MEPEDLEPQKKKPPPKNLEIMGIQELKDYIDDLRAEIARAEATIKSKQSARGAADMFFKKPG
ncbi:MAG: DUF1192 domain-containing protein [Rhodospirillales bacterium]